eukprot:jgi/Bigna1/131610/aug1.15_g6318
MGLCIRAFSSKNTKLPGILCGNGRSVTADRKSDRFLVVKGFSGKITLQTRHELLIFATSLIVFCIAEHNLKLGGRRCDLGAEYRGLCSPGGFHFGRGQRTIDNRDATPAILWTLKGGRPIPLFAGSLKEVNVMARSEDRKIAAAIRERKISGVILVSSDPDGG